MLIKIPNHEGLDPRLLTAFKSVREGRRESKQRFRSEMRASSFPICPKKHVIYKRTPPHRRVFATDSFMSDAATKQGTALHEALQRWFGISVQHHTYGNWVCRKCHKIRRHRTGIQTCRSCGEEMQYLEYEIKPTKSAPFSGHIDMILRYRDVCFLVDFKGSTPDGIKTIQQYGAKYEHYLQVNAYAGAINLGEQEFGKLKKIDKVVIIYVDRGKPWWTWWPVQMPVSRKVYRESVALINKAYQSLEEGTLPRGLCLDPSDPSARWCELKEICFSPLIETKLSDKLYP